MGANARRAKVIGLAAYRNDQRVVPDAPPLHDHSAIGGDERRDLDFARQSVQGAHGARLVFKAGPPGLRDIRHLLLMYVARACRNRVQHGLPNVGAFRIHQGDAQAPTAPCRAAQQSGKLQARDAATNHDHAKY